MPICNIALTYGENFFKYIFVFVLLTIQYLVHWHTSQDSVKVSQSIIAQTVMKIGDKKENKTTTILNQNRFWNCWYKNNVHCFICNFGARDTGLKKAVLFTPNTEARMMVGKRKQGVFISPIHSGGDKGRPILGLQRSRQTFSPTAIGLGAMEWTRHTVHNCVLHQHRQPRAGGASILYPV